MRSVFFSAASTLRIIFILTVSLFFIFTFPIIREPAEGKNGATIVAVTSFGMSRNVCGGTEFNFRVDTVAVQEWMQLVLTDAEWDEINVVEL